MKLESLKNKLFQIDCEQLSKIKAGERQLMSSSHGTSGDRYDTAEASSGECGATWDDICWYKYANQS